MKIWHQSFSVLEELPVYQQVIKCQDHYFDAFPMCRLPNPFIREIRKLVVG